MRRSYKRVHAAAIAMGGIWLDMALAYFVQEGSVVRGAVDSHCEKATLLDEFMLAEVVELDPVTRIIGNSAGRCAFGLIEREDIIGVVVVDVDVKWAAATRFAGGPRSATSGTLFLGVVGNTLVLVRSLR